MLTLSLLLFFLFFGGDLWWWLSSISRDFALEDYEIKSINGLDDTNVGLCVCSYGGLNVAKTRYTSKTACSNVVENSNVVEIYTAKLRTFNVKESFEFVWPHPARLDGLQVESPKPRSIDIRWGQSEDFNTVPVFGTYVTIDYAIANDGVCPAVNDISTPVFEGTDIASAGGWQRHKMKSLLPCLAQIVPTTIGGDLSDSDEEPSLIPDTNYCFRACCSAVPYDGSSMLTHLDHQGQLMGCPSNIWKEIQGRTALPDPPNKIQDDDIQVIGEYDESLTVKWEPLLRDRTISNYLVFIVPQDDTRECEVIYNRNISVASNVTQLTIPGLESVTPYYIGVAAENNVSGGGDNYKFCSGN